MQMHSMTGAQTQIMIACSEKETSQRHESHEGDSALHLAPQAYHYTLAILSKRLLNAKPVEY